MLGQHWILLKWAARISESQSKKSEFVFGLGELEWQADKYATKTVDFLLIYLQQTGKAPAWRKKK